MRQPGVKHIACILFKAGFFLWLASFFNCQPFEPVKQAALILEPIDSFTYTSCFAKAQIIDRGDKEIIKVGFCWSETSQPEISDKYNSANLSSDDKFSAEITGLQAGTDYYVAAYLQQADTVIYSYNDEKDPEHFTTRQYQVPTVGIDSIQKKWYDRAVVWGAVTDSGGRSVLKKGICWSRQPAPDINDSVAYGIDSESFICQMKNLDENTKYFVRAFVTNEEDTYYSKKDSVFYTQPTTDSGTVRDINNIEYNTVKIGNQWWMAENMRVTKFPDNNNITAAQNSSDWSILEVADKAYCFYDRSSANRDVYGALYTWAAAMNGYGSSSANPSGVQGICPDGWHIPSDAEWKELEMFLGMAESDANLVGLRETNKEGLKLKEKGTAHWKGSNEGTNSTGFTALPGGWRQDGTAAFGDLYYCAYFWSSTQTNSNEAWVRKLQGNLATIERFELNKKSGLSVRCVKDL